MSVLLAMTLQATGLAQERFPAPEWISAETLEKVQPYWDCAQRAAGSLERSGESADLIAIAAMEECRAESRALWASFTVDAIVAQRDDSQKIESMFAGFEAKLEKSLIHGVVKLRSARNALDD